jgi:RHS repeat-associated protein
LGRQTSDTVTTLGAGVDGSVMRMDTAYDSQGNAYLLTSYSSVSGGTANIVNQVQRVYNGLGQLTGEYQSVLGSVGVGSPEVQYGYSDPSTGSLLTSMTYPSGRILGYSYGTGPAGALDTAIGRADGLVDVSLDGGVLESYTYLGLARIVTRTYPQAGVQLSYCIPAGDWFGVPNDGGDQYSGLDRFGRVVALNWVSTIGQGGTWGSPGSLERINYAYDPDSNVLSQFDCLTWNGTNYSYDALNRLVSANTTESGAYINQSWTLDALGNLVGSGIDLGVGDSDDLVSVSNSADAQNQYTAFSSITLHGIGMPEATDPVALGYDADGNTTVDENGRHLRYDAWNRLTGVYADNGSGGMGAALATYTYDALGRRTSESEGGTTASLYYSAAGQVMEERTGGTATNSGTVTQQYVWSLAGVNTLVCRDSFAPSSGGGGGVLTQRLYALQDANGNVTALVEGTPGSSALGQVVERYLYDAYGSVTIYAGSYPGLDIATSAYGFRYLFQGGRRDPVTGFYHCGCRDYDPTTQCWTQPDPGGYALSGLDLYEFVGDNPATFVDPCGLARGPSIRLGGNDWIFPPMGDHPAGDGVGGVSLGRHLHLDGNRNVRFYPQAGKIEDANGNIQDAPKCMMQEWRDKTTNPKLRKKMAQAGLLGLLVLANFAMNEASGANQQNVNDLRYNLDLLNGSKNQEERQLSATGVAEAVQNLFQNEEIANATAAALADMAEHPEKAAKAAENLHL